jgi:5-methylcytosine-specific restriction protein A
VQAQRSSSKRPSYGRIDGRRGVALRKARLAREPLCRDCKTKGIYTESTVPDHITPLALGGQDIDANIRCLCGPCHDRRTAEQFGHKAKPTTGVDGWPTGTGG